MPNYVQVIIAVIIAALSYFLGYSSRTDTPPRDKLGDELRRIATEKEADTALVFGKRDGVNAVHIPSGKPIPPCHKRTPDQEQCKFDVKQDPNGKYVLLNKETDQQVQPISEAIVLIHAGSYCTTSSSGGHTTTNCCHSPPCW
ncbi:MAG: hypothetical protein MN733_31910 [Nitrososphaera sp.]|nr:hypothetical protein [Nitrososphaera sp.]